MHRKNIYYTFGLDIAAAVIVWLLFYIYRFIVNDMQLGTAEWSWQIPSYSLVLSLFAFPLTASFIHYLSGIYNRRKAVSRIDEFLTTLVASFFIAVVIYFAMIVDDKVVSYRNYVYSFLILCGLFFVITYTFRLAYTVVLFNRERQGLTVHNVVIIGTGGQAEKALSYINKSKSANSKRLVGYVAAQPADTEAVRKPVLGTVDDLGRIIEEKDVAIAIVALDNASDSELFAVINRLIPSNVETMIVPRRLDLITGNVSIRNLTAEPFINIASLNMPAWQQAVKRAFDIAASAVGLVILSPLLAYLAVRTRLDSKGAILYKQERIGLNGKPFQIYKFRTMRTDAEKDGPHLSQSNDPRITPYGRTMRRYRLDELPQLWNIIRGDMSVVGPRPERRFYISQIEEVAPYYSLVYKVRPGLLSWGPILVGYADTIEKMVRRLDYDIVYTENMSLTLDLKIMLLSISIIFNGKGQ